MNAFGEALNLGFMQWSWWFSSGSMPMDSISDCIPMSSYSPANGVNLKTAFPWVPIPLPMDLWMLEFKFLFPCQWISGCLSSSPYSQPMNLWMHSHEFLFPCQWISGCIPMSSYSPAKFLESFGWVPSMSCHPDSGMPVESHRMRPERDFRGTPYNHTWVPLKSIVEHFRALLRDFCFWAIFLGFPNRKNLDLRRLSAYQRKRGDWSTIQSPQMVIQNGSGMTK